MAKGFNLTAEINLRGPSNIRQIVSDIRRQLGTIDTNINVKLSSQTDKQISTLDRSFKSFNSTLAQTRTISDSTARSLNQLGNAARILGSSLQNIPQNMSQISRAANKVATDNQKAKASTQQMSSEFAEFGRQSALAVRRFAAFATVTGIIFKVSNAIGTATKEFIDFNKALVQVAQVTDTPISSLDFLVNNITSLSTKLGVASKDLIEVSRTLSQAGLSAKDTSAALEALALSALAPSFDNLNNTVEGSIALMRQFGIGANDLAGALGSINAVAAKFAVEAGDIVTAIQRTGGVFASASKGVSEGTDALNEFIAVFTSVRATTRESAETIATGLRTIFTRIQREDTINALKGYGVALTDLEGKFVGPYEAVRRLAQGLNQLDPREIRFSRIVEELGGFRQIGKVIPLIQQFTTAQQALSVAQRGSGSLARDAITAQLSLANQFSKVREEFTALIRSIGQTEGFRDMVRLTLDLTSNLIRIADAAKGALPALTAIFAIKGFQALTQFGVGFLGGIRRGNAKGLNQGGKILGFKDGGSVPGYGRGDTVPAMLEPGEVVMSNRAVRQYGRGNLVRMNRIGFKNGKGPTAPKPVVIEVNDTDTQASHVGASIGDLNKEQVNAYASMKVGRGKRSAKFKPQKTRQAGLTAVETFKLDLPTVANQAAKTGGNGVDAESLAAWIRSNPQRLFKSRRSIPQSSLTTEPLEFANAFASAIANQKKKVVRDAELSKAFEQVKPLLSEEYLASKKDKVDLMSSQAYDTTGSRQIRHEGFDFSKIKDRRRIRFGGGKIQRFVDGGVAKRNVGYIDYDVIANPANEAVVTKGMETSGIKGPRLYTDHLTDLAVKARKDSSLQKLRAIYGVAGSGKTTLARGQGTDKGKLRETTRFPILTPEDIQKANEVLILSSSVSKDKLDSFFSEVDRAYTLSSTTAAEKETIKAQRASRDITGVGLEGRTPGGTMGVGKDTAVGEALLQDRLGSRSVVLGRSDSGKLRRKSGDELVEVIKKKIGFTWGGFAPMTAGHESIMDSAAAMGIPPEDFIYLVGANEGIKVGDASSYRTAIFDQDARVLLAKAGAGAKGATVLPKPRDFVVPEAFDVSPETGRRKVIIPGKGSTAFVADKGPEELKKYKDAGYKAKNLPRTGGISGTMVRELIEKGNLAELQKVLSPGVYELISNNIGRIQNRAQVLPQIISQVQQNQDIKLADVEKAIKAVGISRIDKKKLADPEYAAKVQVLEELRNQRDKIKSAAAFEPYKLLDELARSQPDKYGLDFSTGTTPVAKPIRTARGKPQTASLGGLIQKFMAGSPGGVEPVQEAMTEQKAALLGRSEILGFLKSRPGGLEDTAKAVGISSSDMYKILGVRSPDEKTKTLQDAIRREYVKTYNRRLGAQKGVQTRLTGQGLKFAAAGMLGKPFAPETYDVGNRKVLITAGVMDPALAAELDATYSAGIESIAQEGAQKAIISNVTKGLLGGKQLELDFDRTLAVGADDIASLKDFRDPTIVQEKLKSASLTRLGSSLVDLIKSHPELIPNMRVVTARSQSTVPLIQQWLADKGLALSDSQFVGVGGDAQMVSESDIPALKAAQLRTGSLFVDDSEANIKAAEASGKGIETYRYGAQLTIPNPNAEATAQGVIFEKMIQNLGGPGRVAGLGFDYPQGLGPAAKFFGIDSDIPTDAKRTIVGAGTIKDNVKTYLKAMKYRVGGKVSFGTGFPFPRRISNKYFKDMQKMLDTIKIEKAWEAYPKDERILIGDQAVGSIKAASEEPFNLELFKKSFTDKISRDGLFQKMGYFSRFIGLPSGDLASFLPSQIDFTKFSGDYSQAVFSRDPSANSTRGLEGVDLSEFGFTEADKQDAYGYSKLIEEKKKEVEKVLKTPVKTFDDGSFRYDEIKARALWDEINDLKQKYGEKLKLNSEAIKKAKESRKASAESTGRGSISIAQDPFDSNRRRSYGILYHEMVHQLFNSLRTKQADTFTKYKERVNSLFGGDNDDLADAFDLLSDSRGGGYSSADVVYGRSYKLSGLQSVLMNASRRKLDTMFDPANEKQKAGDQEALNELRDVSSKANVYKKAREFKPLNPSVNRLLLATGSYSQDVLDRMEDNGKEEFLTTLVQNLPALDSNLEGILGSTLNELLASGGISRRSFAQGGLADATSEMASLMGGLYGNRKSAETAPAKKEKDFGKIGLNEDGNLISAGYYKNDQRSGYVQAYKMKDNLYYVGLSKATSGYGPRLYDVVMEAVSEKGAMLTSDRSMVSAEAQKVWQYYFKNRGDVKKTPLEPEDWTKNQSLIDPKLYGRRETWPPPTDPAWVLQSGYSKSPSLINDPNSVVRANKKPAVSSGQMALQYFQRANGGRLGFADGGSVPALVSNGEAYVPPKVAKRIGYGTLNKMNMADKNGMGRFSEGGISVFKGPGTGTSDSIPTSLPVGSFIIREKATKALGLNKGGGVKIGEENVSANPGRSRRTLTTAGGQVLGSFGLRKSDSDGLQGGESRTLEGMGSSAKVGGGAINRFATMVDKVVADFGKVDPSVLQTSFLEYIQALEKGENAQDALSGAQERLVMTTEKGAARYTAGWADAPTKKSVTAQYGASGTWVRGRNTGGVDAPQTLGEDDFMYGAGAEAEPPPMQEPASSYAVVAKLSSASQAAQKAAKKIDITSPDESMFASFRAAETGDQNAAKMVAEAQRKQISAIARQIREADKTIAPVDALAAAERRVADAWGGLYKEIKETTQDQNALQQSSDKLSQAQNQSALEESSQTQGGASKERNKFNFSGLGTALAFTGPMLAGQLGETIGGATGAGVAGVASNVSTFTSIGSQFGGIGAIGGLLVGLATSIDSWGASVANFEATATSARIDQIFDTTGKAFERMSVNINDKGAFNDVVGNFQRIQTEETKLAAFRERANAPSMLTGIGRRLGILSSPTAETVGGEKAVNQQKAAAIAQQFLESQIQATQDYATVSQKLQQGGSSFDQLYAAILEADTAYAIEVEKIKQSNDTEDRKNQKINELTAQKTQEIRTGIETRFSEIERAKANNLLTKQLNLVSVSLTRTFDTLNQSINAASFSLDQASESIQNIVSDSADFSTKLRSSNILENPRAYSRTEQNAAISQSAQFAGQDRQFVEQFARFSLDIEDSMTTALNQAKAGGVTDPNVVGDRLSSLLTSQLDNMFGPQLGESIRSQFKPAIAELVKGGNKLEDISIQDILENIPGLNQQIQSSKQVFEALNASAKFLENALNFVGAAAKEYGSLQDKLAENIASSQNIIAQSNLSFQEAMGKRITLEQRRQARTSVAATKAGVRPQDLNAGALSDRRGSLIQQKQNIEKSLANMAQSFDKRDLAASRQFIALNKELGLTESSIRQVNQALDSLPQNIEQNINDIISEISRIQQKSANITQASTGFGERLLGSTPQELQELGTTFNVLNSALSGNVNTIQQSQAAQLAYRQALTDGKTQQEAMVAAQQAFAGQTRDVLGLFNELSSMSGLEEEELRPVRAELFKNLASSQGSGLQNNPIFQTIISRLEQPPEQSREIKELQALLASEQRSLIDTTQRINQNTLDKQTSVLEAANQKFIDALSSIEVRFNTEQLRSMGLGLTPPGRVPQTQSKGGVVYASDGTYVNFAPKGTDTIPAMLTPGEFVVNRSATQKNLPLLKSINSGAYSKGGIAYLEEGGIIGKWLSNWIGWGTKPDQGSLGEKSIAALGGFAKSLLPGILGTVGSIAGGVLGSLAIPPFGTVAGALAGGMGGAKLGDILNDAIYSAFQGTSLFTTFEQAMNENPKAALVGGLTGEIATVVAGGIGKIGSKTLESAIKTTTAKLVKGAASRASAARPVLAGPMNQIISKMDNVIADSTSVVPSLIESVKKTAIEYLTDKTTGSAINAGVASLGRLTDAQQMKSGGTVYASHGTLIPYQPRGTDTVPAMLTPGEFVVNAKATKNNLGLLRSINSSDGSGKTYSRGGVVYAAAGVDLTKSVLATLGLSADDFSSSAAAAATAPPTATTTTANNGLMPTFRKIFGRLGGGRSLTGMLSNAVGGVGRTLYNVGSTSVGSVGSRILGGLRGGLGAISSPIVNWAEDAKNVGMGWFNLMRNGPDAILDFVDTPSVKAAMRGAGTAMRGAGTVLRAAGPVIGAAQGYAADTDKTKRSRLANTALGALTGTGTTMGDVGAQSTLGSLFGAQQGGSLDRNLGNLNQFALTTAQYSRLGPVAAPIVAAVAMNAQELAGYSGDLEELRATETFAAEASQRSRQSGRITPTTTRIAGESPEDYRDRVIEARAIERTKEQGVFSDQKGFDVGERQWITTAAKLQIQIEQAKRESSPEKVRELEEKLKIHNKTRKEIFSTSRFNTVGGVLANVPLLGRMLGSETTTTETKNPAEIEAAIQSEVKYQRALGVARREEIAIEQDRQERNRPKTKEEIEGEAKYRKDQEARLKETRELGLSPDVSDTQLQAAKDRRAQQELQKAEQEKLATARTKEFDQIAFNRFDTPETIKAKAISRDDGGLPADVVAGKEFDKWRQIVQEKEGIFKQIRDIQNKTVIFDPFANTTSFRELNLEEQQQLLDLHTKLRQKDTEIFTAFRVAQEDYIEKNKLGDMSTEDLTDKLWADYDDGMLKKAQESQRREKVLANKEAEKQAQMWKTLSRISNIQLPSKFENPGRFLTLRSNILEKLKGKFPLSGDVTTDIQTMQQYGLDAKIAEAIFRPFDNNQIAAVASMIPVSSKTDPALRNQISLLSQASSTALNTAKNNPYLLNIIDKNPKVNQKFKTAFIKSVNDINNFNKMVGGFNQLDKRNQDNARGNLLKRLTRQGYIDPRNPDASIEKLNALGGSNVAQFLFPNKQAQNKAIRIANPKNLGGIIYANNGMLVPYEPKGTDTVPAMLTPGEFIVNKQATSRHRGLLESINRSKGGSVKYLQEGGTAEDMTQVAIKDGVKITKPSEIYQMTKQNLGISKDTNKLGYNTKDILKSNTDDVPLSDKSAHVKLDAILEAINKCCRETQQAIDQLIKKVKQLNRRVQNIIAAIAAALPQLGAGQLPPMPQLPPLPGPAGGAPPPAPGRPVGRSKGGIIYANNGMLVPYQPRGTDTVPAMLTPGEFVVNARSTAQHLPLLKSINSGAMSLGGVVYAADGIKVPRPSIIEEQYDNQNEGIMKSGLEDAPEVRAQKGKLIEIIFPDADRSEDIPQPKIWVINSKNLDIEKLKPDTPNAYQIRLYKGDPHPEIKPENKYYWAWDGDSWPGGDRYVPVRPYKRDDPWPLDLDDPDHIKDDPALDPPGWKDRNPNFFANKNPYGLFPYDAGMPAWRHKRLPYDFHYHDAILPEAIPEHEIVPVEVYNRGGIIYASQGQYVNYQPRGTDTVPAMLTPGEFVVNRAATQKNLPLLKAINNSKGGSINKYSKGGAVYLQKGGEAVKTIGIHGGEATYYTVKKGLREGYFTTKSVERSMYFDGTEVNLWDREEGGSGQHAPLYRHKIGDLKKEKDGKNCSSEFRTIPIDGTDDSVWYVPHVSRSDPEPNYKSQRQREDWLAGGHAKGAKKRYDERVAQQNRIIERLNKSEYLNSFLKNMLDLAAEYECNEDNLKKALQEQRLGISTWTAQDKFDRLNLGSPKTDAIGRSIFKGQPVGWKDHDRFLIRYQTGEENGKPVYHDVDLLFDHLIKSDQESILRTWVRPPKQSQSPKPSQPSAATEKDKAAVKIKCDEKGIRERRWVDASGEYATVGRFQGLKDEVVEIRKSNGSVIRVPLNRLSETDRNYVEACHRQKQVSSDTSPPKQPAPSSVPTQRPQQPPQPRTTAQEEAEKTRRTPSGPFLEPPPYKPPTKPRSTTQAEDRSETGKGIFLDPPGNNFPGSRPPTPLTPGAQRRAKTQQEADNAERERQIRTEAGLDPSSTNRPLPKQPTTTPPTPRPPVGTDRKQPSTSPLPTPKSAGYTWLNGRLIGDKPLIGDYVSWNNEGVLIRRPNNSNIRVDPYTWGKYATLQDRAKVGVALPYAEGGVVYAQYGGLPENEQLDAIDIFDPNAMKNTLNSLSATLLQYTSNEQGQQKLLMATNQNYGITGIRQSSLQSGSSAMFDVQSRNLVFRDRVVRSAMAKHEMAHALANSTHNTVPARNQQFANQMGDFSSEEAMQIWEQRAQLKKQQYLDGGIDPKKVEEQYNIEKTRLQQILRNRTNARSSIVFQIGQELVDNNYQKLADTSYSIDQLDANPNELFAVIASIADTPEFGNMPASQAFLRKSMQTMGYNKGGVVYAQEGGLDGVQRMIDRKNERMQKEMALLGKKLNLGRNAKISAIVDALLKSNQGKPNQPVLDRLAKDYPAFAEEIQKRKDKASETLNWIPHQLPTDAKPKTPMDFASGGVVYAQEGFDPSKASSSRPPAQAVGPLGYHKGGIIYASEGTLVNYQPRGTDTVPAMLTPGEFVVNRAATQRNLPLLQSINSGNYANGGVVYAEEGKKITGSEDWKKKANWNYDSMSAAASANQNLATNYETIRQKALSYSKDSNRDQFQESADNAVSMGYYKPILIGRSPGISTVGGSFSYKMDILEFQKRYGAVPSHYIDEYTKLLKEYKPPTYKAKNKNSGGIIYASEGTLVNYQPRGTDTVPAMLTPGEFVINKKATQANLPLLQAINSGNYADGGAVYLQRGSGSSTPTGLKQLSYEPLIQSIRYLTQSNINLAQINNRQTATPSYLRSDISTPAITRIQEFFEARRINKEARFPQRQNEMQNIVAPPNIAAPQNNNLTQIFNSVNQQLTTFTSLLGRVTQGLVSPTQTNITNNPNGVNNIDGLSAFTQTFNTFINQLSSIRIPETITMQLAPLPPIQIVLTGAEALASIEPGLQRIISSRINEALSSFSNNFDGINIQQS